MIPLSPQQTKVIGALVRETAPAIKLIKSAMAKGKVDWRRPYTTPMLKVALPDLADMRMLADILQAAALLAHEDGDDIVALEHVREMLFVGRAAGDEPFLVSHMVAIGIDAMAVDVCRQISPTLQLGKEPAMRDPLRRTIADLLNETDGSAHLRRAMQGERVEQVDTALALASGKLTAEELAGLLWPPQLEKFKLLGLTPAYLPAVPADPMTVGGSLIYSPDDEVVYSVGVTEKTMEESPAMAGLAMGIL